MRETEKGGIAAIALLSGMDTLTLVPHVKALYVKIDFVRKKV